MTGVATPTSGTTNRLTGAANYDGPGNLTSWNGNAYQYNAFNLQKKIVTGGEDWRYIYTADDERFWSYRVGGGGSIWALRGLDAKVLRRYSAHSGWNNYEDYVYRDGALLASTLSPAGNTRHFHLDHLGTPRLITDQNGTTVGTHQYYPFGQEQTAAQEGETLKFTGHERDLLNTAGMGDDLDYMHARHYSPLTGRFLSVDRISGSVRNPQSWNRYAYVLGNPLKYVDPFGLCASINGIRIDDCSTTVIGQYWDSTGFDEFLEFGDAFRDGFGGAEFIPRADFAAQVAFDFAGRAGWLAGAFEEAAELYEDYTNNVSNLDAFLHGDLGAGFDLALSAYGGGKTAGKVRKGLLSQGKQGVADARAKVKQLDSVANKTPADKTALQAAKRELQRRIDQMRRSEEHARTGQGHQ